MKRFLVTALLAVSTTACSFEMEGSGELSQDSSPSEVALDSGASPGPLPPPLNGLDGAAQDAALDSGLARLDAAQLADATLAAPDGALPGPDAALGVDASSVADATVGLPDASVSAPDAAAPLVLVCPAIPASGLLPVQLACVAEPVLPAMSWSGGPANVGSYLIAHVMRSNRTGVTTATWALCDIPPTQQQVPSGDISKSEKLVPGARLSLNDALLPVTTPAACYAQSRTDELRLYALSIARLPPGIAAMEPAGVLAWLEQSGAILARYTLPAHFP